MKSNYKFIPPLVLIFIFTNCWDSTKTGLLAQNIVKISANFPGGNIIVDDCENESTLSYQVTSDTINLRPDLRDTEGDWFYWYFEVTGAENRTLYFQFPGNCVGNFGPAVSRDRGESWQWLYNEARKAQNHFSYTFGGHEKAVSFCVAIPYLQADFERHISSLKDNPYVSVQSLTTSEKGRVVEELHIRHPENSPKYKVLITARHHACEMVASYVLEGIIESTINGEDTDMKWLRDNVEFLIVPFMDKDGVEDGDQGKNRKPHDHNRDYSGKSIYKSTSALREKVPIWSEGKLTVALDVHCPYITGEWNGNEYIYFVGAKEKNLACEQKKFVNTLIKHQKGNLKIPPSKALIEYGTSWNTAKNYNKGLWFSKWASTLDGVSLSVGMEIPYSNHLGQQVTPQNSRLVGNDLASAISIYLQGLENLK